MASFKADGVNSWAIRPAVPGDAPAILRMVKELTVQMEVQQDVVKVSQDVLLRDGFGQEPWFKCLIAEEVIPEGDQATKLKPIGYALYFHGYSTWNGRMLYLEDIYVDPSARGKGVGKGLLKRVAQVAVESGCYKIHWVVLEWNKLAIGFYDKIGAECLEEWRLYRLAGENVLEFAGKR